MSGKYKLVILFLLMSFQVCILHAQSRKNVKEYGIITRTEYEEDYENSNGKAYKEEFTKFDKEGNVIEEVKYESNGNIKEKTTYVYNKNNDVTREVRYDKNNQIEKTIEYTYDGELKTSKTVYDNKGRIITKKTYEYTFRE